MKQRIPIIFLLGITIVITVIGGLGWFSAAPDVGHAPYASALVGLMMALYLTVSTGPWRAALMVAVQIATMLAMRQFVPGAFDGLGAPIPDAIFLVFKALEPLLVATLIDRLWRIDRSRDLPSFTGSFLVVSLFTPLLVSGVVVLTTYPEMSSSAPVSSWQMFLEHWLSHTAGYILFGSLLTVLMQRAKRADPPQSQVQPWVTAPVFIAQFGLLYAALAGPDLIEGSATDYNHHPWLLLLATPMPMMAAFKLGFRQTIVLTSLSGLAVLWMTNFGLGPFVAGRGVDRPMDLRLMIIIGAKASLMLAALASRLNNAVAIARRADAAKRQFLASIGHEMRSSLTGVIGAAELLQNEMPENGDPEGRLGLIQRSGVLLTRLVEDTLEYAALGRDGVDLSPVNFSLEDAAKDVAVIFRPLLNDKGVDLKLDIDPDVEETIFADGARIRQIMINLMSNASKFTQSGEVRLTVRTRAMGGRWVVCEIEVADTGPGVPSDMKEKIFDAFQKSGASVGGLGLGLAISRDIARAMRGSISVYDNPDGGAVFRFKCVTEKHREGVQSETGLEPLSEGVGGSYSILIAEDNQAGRIVMKAMLNAAGMDVTTVEDGAQAVDAVKDRSYDLILMDMHMPGMSGLAAISAIRRMQDGETQTPILVVTGADGSEMELTQAEGIEGVLSKPLTAESLITAVNSVLSGQQNVSSSAH